MIIFASGRQIISGVPLRRFAQQISSAPKCTRKAQLWFIPRPSPVILACRATSTSRLLTGITPQSWQASRFLHGDAPHAAETTNNKDKFSMKALGQAPKPALYLGFSGLLPFLAAPLLMAATQAFYPEVAYAQVVYGASIVSFLGGARWGFALPPGSPAQPDWMNLGNSVVPSLVAWLALLCKDNITEGALIVVMGLGLSLHYDLTLLPGYPAWFKAMRTVLTLVATFSLVATITLKKFCTEKRIKDIQK
ncbi:transmembrane protein 69-like [Cololabis saira]|uniref:transmembrane protein 69-like n=1 Tax=Cololabis saira TaxID=129043 RepID=UPI002AD466D5|nr:transmembrane protein 69-like [Cololabis saira]XP_061587292.1 transmembrane protein 69-like [Cololabis saira]